MGQRAVQQTRQYGVLGWNAGTQKAISIQQTIALAQDTDGAVIRGQDPSAAVDLDDAEASAVEQRRRGRARDLGLDQRMAYEGKLGDMRPKAPDQPDLVAPPASLLRGVADTPYDVETFRAVQPNVKAILGSRIGQRLVVRGRPLLLHVRIQLSRMHRLAVIESEHPRDAFVPEEILLEIPALPVRPALSAQGEPRQEGHPINLRPASEDQHAAAFRAGSLTDQVFHLGPTRIAQRGLIEQRQDSLVPVSGAFHATARFGATHQPPGSVVLLAIPGPWTGHPPESGGAEPGSRPSNQGDDQERPRRIRGR